MADVDTRLGRQSATCILLPHMLAGFTPDTSGVSQAERQAVTWSYSGILAAGAAVVTVIGLYFYRLTMQGDNL